MTIQGQATGATVAAPCVLPVEIAFLREHGVSERVLKRAAEIAASTGVSADEVIIKEDLVTEREFYAALAAELRLPLMTGRIPLDPQVRFPESAHLGVAPLASVDGIPRFVLAPTGKQIVVLLSRRRPLEGIALASPTVLTREVFRVRSVSIAHEAANHLPEHRPDQSYRNRITNSQIVTASVGAGTLAFLGFTTPEATLSVVMVLSGIVFLGMVVLRLAAAREAISVAPLYTVHRWADRALPTYTVVVPLRRERRVLPRLIRALDALDYPKAKLEIMLVIEADDREMLDAFRTTRLPGCFKVIVAPSGGPRTKPRALNVALPIARGDLLVVFDAEDVPDPQQLRLAVATFARCGPEVACLQARLVIDNTADNWLTGLFTIEYATLFDVINPALAAFGFPVPLGGTSSHFRTTPLRSLGGWDAWNVTEDADLGIRLALAGYRVADLPSATLEEAPVTLDMWLKQRTRWMKGFMQVVVTHSRHPLRAWRALGSASFFAATAMTLGTVTTALVFPLFTFVSIGDLVEGGPWRTETSREAIAWSVGLTLFVSGVVAIFVPATTALRRRGWLHLLPLVPLLPLYYALVSLAAWRALAELFIAPSRWHKTEHGLARTSRSGLFTTAEAAPAPPRRAGD